MLLLRLVPFKYCIYLPVQSLTTNPKCETVVINQPLHLPTDLLPWLYSHPSMCRANSSPPSPKTDHVHYRLIPVCTPTLNHPLPSMITDSNLPANSSHLPLSISSLTQTYLLHPLSTTHLLNYLIVPNHCPQINTHLCAILCYAILDMSPIPHLSDVQGKAMIRHLGVLLDSTFQQLALISHRLSVVNTLLTATIQAPFNFEAYDV